MSEHHEAIALVQWLQMKGLRFAHIPNEASYRNKKIQSEGISRGFPDYIVVTSQGLLFIELKTQNGHVSKEQKEWIITLQECDGVESMVCYGAEEAIKFVQSYL